MLRRGSNPIREEEWNQKVTKAADSFWSAFQMTENGKVKSTLLMYSFCLSVVFLGIYGALYYFMIDPLHMLTSGAPDAVESLVGTLVPAVVGTAVCCALVWPLSKEKRLLPVAYVWFFLWALACLITMLVLLQGEGEARRLFLQFFVLFFPAPVVLGNGAALILYYRYWKQRVACTKTSLEKRQ